MSDLQLLARQKVEADMQSRIDQLPQSIQALQRQLAARGLRRSGAMLKQVVALCEEQIAAHGTVVSSEYSWAVKQALLASQSWVERLVTASSVSLRALTQECAGHVERAVQVAGGPDLSVRLVGQVEAKRDSVANEVALSLRSVLAEKRRGLLRGLPGSLVDLFVKVVGGSK